MKRICLLFLTFAFTGQFTCAQNQTAASTPAKTNVKIQEGYAMRNGTMFRIGNGKMQPMERAAILPNGTRVYKSGLVVMPQNRQLHLSEGYAITTQGKVVVLHPDLVTYQILEDHSQKAIVNPDSSIFSIPADTSTKNSHIAGQDLLTRQAILIQDINRLVQEKARLLQNSSDNSDNLANPLQQQQQQPDPEIKQLEEHLHVLQTELKDIETRLQVH